MKYIATVGLTNDKSKKRFEPGDTVTDKDFPKYIIEGWLKRGHLKEANDGGNGN